MHINISYVSILKSIYPGSYLDKEKIGIIKELDNSKEQTNVFLDDLVCGICACACGKIAHNA